MDFEDPRFQKIRKENKRMVISETLFILFIVLAILTVANIASADEPDSPPFVPFTGGLALDCISHPKISNAWLCTVKPVKYNPPKEEAPKIKATLKF